MAGKAEKYRIDNARMVNKKKFPDSYLYVLKIENTNHYKIGVSNNPKRRIADIGASMPFKISKLYCFRHKNTYELEEMIHDNFISKETRHEWFELNDEDLSALFETLKDFREEFIYLTKI